MTDMSSYTYKCVPAGIFQANCTILGNKETGNYLLFDVGGDVEDIMNEVKSMNLTICLGVYFTHGHFDHILGAPEIKEATQAPLALHKDDLDLYSKIDEQCRFFGVPKSKVVFPPITRILNENDEIVLDELKGTVIHCPGHSKGSCAFYFKDLKIVINGDTLFQYSYGRTDLWGGSYSELKASIKNKLFKLPTDTIVIVGHGSNTTIGSEIRGNEINY